jgi:hypothetical protein
MTAKEKVLEQAPSWTEAQATAVLAVVEAQRKLEAYFEAEAKLTPAELKAREDRRAEANARELIAEGQVRELSEEEWEQMADEQARKYLGISAAEFARRLKTGEMDVDDDPDVMRVAMLLGPLAEDRPKRKDGLGT